MNARRALFTTISVEVLRKSNALNGKYFDTTTSYQSWTAMNAGLFQLNITHPPFGLHFIRENIQGVDVLEYPTWEEYSAALKKGYDIVGISFFTWTAYDAIIMAKMAKDHGVAEVWGGNYGVMTPGIETYFDRVFPGYCEAGLKKAIEGTELQELRHPPLIGKAKWSMAADVGYLYTKRGCKAGCRFCPTPWFNPTDSAPDPRSISKVLEHYQNIKARAVIILDETFLDQGEYSERIIDELAGRGLRWVCLTRADRISGRVGILKKKGLHSALIGVESIRDRNLDFVSKKQKMTLVKDTVRELKEHGCFPLGTYMLGFPDDTPETIREDIETLSSWGFFLMQFTILTPFPGTPLWLQLKDRIIDHDWRHYDSYHLVWDHPHLKPEQARQLLYYALKKINRPSNYLRKILGYQLSRPFRSRKDTGGPARPASAE